MARSVNRIVLFDDVSLPKLPEDGRAKRVPIARIMANTDFYYSAHHRRAPAARRTGQHGAVLFTKGEREGSSRYDSSSGGGVNAVIGGSVPEYFST